MTVSNLQKMLDFADREGVDPDDYLGWEDQGPGLYTIRAGSENLRIRAARASDAFSVALDLRPDERDLEIESWTGGPDPPET